MKAREAIRQVLYDALTNPILSYDVEGDPRTVPVANVVPNDVWQAGGAFAPMPLVSIGVSTLPGPTWSAVERKFSALITVVSANDQDDAESIMEAIRLRLHGADTEGLQDAVTRPPDLSRATSGAALGVAIREIRENTVLRSAFEPDEKRWYMTAEYVISAA